MGAECGELGECGGEVGGSNVRDSVAAHRDSGSNVAADARDDDYADGNRGERDGAVSIQVVGLNRHRLDDPTGLERGG